MAGCDTWAAHEKSSTDGYATLQVPTMKISVLNYCTHPRLTTNTVQWSRDRRNVELDPDSNFGSEDMLRAVLHSGYGGVRVIVTIQLRG
jgi:hypothetical protein